MSNPCQNHFIRAFQTSRHIITIQLLLNETTVQWRKLFNKKNKSRHSYGAKYFFNRLIWLLTLHSGHKPIRIVGIFGTSLKKILAAAVAFAQTLHVICSSNYPFPCRIKVTSKTCEGLNKLHVSIYSTICVLIQVQGYVVQKKNNVEKTQVLFIN